MSNFKFVLLFMAMISKQTSAGCENKFNENINENIIKNEKFKLEKKYEFNGINIIYIQEHSRKKFQQDFPGFMEMEAFLNLKQNKNKKNDYFKMDKRIYKNYIGKYLYSRNGTNPFAFENQWIVTENSIAITIDTSNRSCYSVEKDCMESIDNSFNKIVVELVYSNTSPLKAQCFFDPPFFSNYVSKREKYGYLTNGWTKEFYIETTKIEKRMDRLEINEKGVNGNYKDKEWTAFNYGRNIFCGSGEREERLIQRCIKDEMHLKLTMENEQFCLSFKNHTNETYEHMKTYEFQRFKFQRFKFQRFKFQHDIGRLKKMKIIQSFE